MDALLCDPSLCAVASPRDAVHRDECCRSFATPFSPGGVLVRLTTFAGSSAPLAFRDHAVRGAAPALYLRVVARRFEKPPADVAVPAAAPTVIGVGVPGGFARAEDRYDTVTAYSVVGIADGRIAGELPYPGGELPAHVAESARSVAEHAGAALRSDADVWALEGEPLRDSVYAAGLPVVENGLRVDPDPGTWRCAVSGEATNLWLNLSTGHIGGGRKNWDGSGGSNGALDHYKETGGIYPLVVKLGTVCADEESIDCYSYAPDEDGPVRIPGLAALLARRGINAASMRKVEKSTAELEVELNASYAFDAITEAGADLVPASGPGHRGLVNLGNSCYVNSILQLLCSGAVGHVADRYGGAALTADVAAEDAPDDLLVQTAKVTRALLDGAPPETGDAAVPGTIAPRMFRDLVGRGHADFRTGRMQDAAQYVQHLWERLDAAEAAEGDAPPSSAAFTFRTEERRVCAADGKVQYAAGPRENLWSLRLPVEAAAEETDQEVKRRKQEEAPTEEKKRVPRVALKDCVDAWAAAHVVDGRRWDHLGTVSPSSVSTKFANFPSYLLVQTQRYELGPDWTPVKIEAEVDVPSTIDLEGLRASGPADGEELVPEEQEDVAMPDAAAAPASPADDPLVAQLMDMGFGRNGCIRAVAATGGGDAAAATTWIFEHSTDEDFNDPLPAAAPATAGPAAAGVDEAVVSSLTESLGMFTADQVRAALVINGGAGDRAADWLFSHMDDLDGAVAAAAPAPAPPPAPETSHPPDDGPGQYTLVGLVSHIGKNTSSGHYVCHLRRPSPDGGAERWVIYNDEKVAVSEAPPVLHAYLYLFRRADVAVAGAGRPE